MKVGFTGTRKGMTKLQLAFVKRALHLCQATVVHHGACEGADQDFHYAALLLKVPVVLHPGVNRQGYSPSRAECPMAKEVKAEKFYLDRDKDIVNEVDMMIATPKEKKEQLRSGTWTTIRYAKKKGKYLLIVYPDGTCNL